MFRVDSNYSEFPIHVNSNAISKAESSRYFLIKTHFENVTTLSRFPKPIVTLTFTTANGGAAQPFHDLFSNLSFPFGFFCPVSFYCVQLHRYELLGWARPM